MGILDNSNNRCLTVYEKVLYNTPVHTSLPNSLVHVSFFYDWYAPVTDVKVEIYAERHIDSGYTYEKIQSLSLYTGLMDATWQYIGMYRGISGLLWLTSDQEPLNGQVGLAMAEFYITNKVEYI